jgi:hypothetical protein
MTCLGRPDTLSKLLAPSFKNDGPWNQRPLFMGKAGSVAYGTSTHDSDVDYRGVFLAEPRHLIGLSNVETYTEDSPIDLQCFELRHYARLCLKGSPLQLEMLFYPEDTIEFRTCNWDELVRIRKSFLGKHLKKTLGGFAQGDIRRIEGNLTQKCGAKGKLLIQKYGYNTKHAASAWRLLRMAELLWTTGELVVRLPESDRKEIVAIKQGKYQRDEFLNIMKGEDERIFALADKADLPALPDFKLVETTIIGIYHKALII